MQIALTLAERGMGFVSPNPMVGAVIVRDGEILGQGWHQRCGDLHAERNAFADCKAKGIDCAGADLYVTLEPCCHYGKQPPCTEAILANGISHVYIGSSDPNPLVSGKGAAYLREHGVAVTEGILKASCDRLNAIFFHYITTKTPYVTMKYAMTLDGKIACYTGASKWITGDAAREHVQKERLRHSGIMVGVGTVLADDPMLTCRIPGGRNPLRIICDTYLRTPLSSAIVQSASDVPTMIVCGEAAAAHADAFQAAGCRVLPCETAADGKIDLQKLMRILGNEQIDSILLEGGGELNWSALHSGIVTGVQAYIAPKLFGGAAAKTPVQGQGVPDPANGFQLTNIHTTMLGDDMLIEGEICLCSPES